jgi:hypothetical protein
LHSRRPHQARWAVAIAAATAFLSIAPSSLATDLRLMAQADERARNERLEGQFQAQARDVAWAEATEASVRSTLTSLPPLQGIEPQALECRSSTCRLELIENVPGVLQAALPLFAARMAHALTGMSASTAENGNADVRVVLYLSR